MRLVNTPTKRAKKFINTFLFLKTDNLTVINVIRYQLNSLKCPIKSPLEKIETCHYPIFNCAKIQSQWDQRLFKMYKHTKISKILKNLVVIVVTKSRNNCLKLTLL